MIDFIGIKNFKSLLDTNFPLANLNLFSGLNGMGKSTLIQSMLLLRQSYESSALEKGLLLNGEYLNLGTGRDVLAFDADEDEVKFTFTFTGRKPFHFVFTSIADSNLMQTTSEVNKIDFDKLPLFNNCFQYLSAERIGPQTQHTLSAFHVKNSLGVRGEYTAHFIAENGLKELAISELIHPSSLSNTLLVNIEGWMSEITPGLKIRAQIRSQFNLVTLNYAFLQGRMITVDIKPQNVGFGLSYVLPVITSILAAKKGDLLIIENPESHLHPGGQSVLGKLCALAANNGVQIMVESHSDHFLNGIRVAVKNKIINHDDVQIFFLERHANSPAHASEVSNPKIDENGRLDFWPKGFFDETDKQLSKLL